MGPYSRQLMQGAGMRSFGNVLQNLGMGIMGLSQRNPQAAMAAFGRPLEDPRKAMMEAARMDMATQQMAAQQAQEAQEAQAREQRMRTQEAYLSGLTPAERLRAEMIGAAEHAKMQMEADLEAPDLMEGVRINPVTGEQEIDPLWIEKQSYKKPLVQVNQGAKVPANFRPVFNETGEMISVEPITGGPADPTAKPVKLTPQGASSVAALNVAIDDMAGVKDFLVDENGKVDFRKVAKMNIPVVGGSWPKSEEGKYGQAIFNAVNAQLRAESGAEVPEPEVRRAMKRFFPSVTDDDGAALAKIERLQTLLSESLRLLDPYGTLNQPQTPAGAPAAARPTDPLGIR